MIPIVVTYNLVFIEKIGYKDTDNNGIFVKVRGTQEEDDVGGQEEGEEGEPTQDQVAPSLVRLWMCWGRFSSVLVRSTLDLIV